MTPKEEVNGIISVGELKNEIANMFVKQSASARDYFQGWGEAWSTVLAEHVHDFISKKIEDALTRRDAEIQRLSNIIRDEGWAIPDGTLRLGLVNAQERIRELEKEVVLFKHQWGNAEDSNMKLNEKIAEYRKLVSDLESKLKMAVETLDIIISIGTTTYGKQKTNSDPHGKTWEELNPQASIAKQALEQIKGGW